MAIYRQFSGASGTVLVEVEAVPGGAAQPGNLSDLLRPIGDIATILASAQNGESSQARPDIEVQFGIKGLADGGVAIALNGSGNLQVKMIWKAPRGMDGLPSNLLTGGS